MSSRALSALRRSGPPVARWYWEQLAPDLAFVPIALVACWSLFAVRGMPMTHDGLGLAFLEGYRRAYKGGDFFPLWTSFSEDGHGSAFPILYHRLHGQVFAFLALKIGSLLALKVSIPVLLVVGAAGLRRLCLGLGVRPWLAWTGGILLMSANYTVTDWFVRGATAELTAFMLLPWCLREALRALDDDWAPVRFAVASALLFYAHMMTFYVFVFVATILVAGRLLELLPFGWARVRPALRRGAIFTALLTCAIGPYAAAVKYVLAFSGLQKIEMRGDDAAFFPWKSYLIDPNFSWSRAHLPGLASVEIGRWMLFCLAVFLVVEPSARSAVRKRAGSLVVVAMVFLVLQRKELSFVFSLLPGAASIQFPSRLLVFIVPIVIVCMTIAVEMGLRSRAPWVRAAAAVLPVLAAAGQVNLARSTQSAIWGQQVARSDIDAAMGNEQDVTTGKMAMFAAWHLYAPKRQGSPPAAPFLEAMGDCTISSPGLTGGAPTHLVHGNRPIRGLSFTVHGGQCTVKLNQYQSTLLRADFSGPGELRSARDGTTTISAPVDGTEVTLRQRGVFDLAKKWIVEKARRRP
ncbi:MAG TPA: hypothetical protein VGL81_08600 [Polyangiaceae bacterium]